MKAKFIRFGVVRVKGKKYQDDFLVDHGTISLRDKAPSRRFRERFDGHTPLSASEYIPWDCERLIIGTGAEGLLPVMKKVRRQAKRRGVKLVIMPTPEACKLLSRADLETTNAIIHVTC